MKIDTKQLTIQKAHQHLLDGDFSAVELSEEYLKTVKEQDKEIHAYLEVFDDVIEQAKEADKKIKIGKNITPLTGIPIAIKDNLLQEGRKASAGSKILEKYTATYDSTVVSKLKEAGAVLLGRTNCDEFAMGSSTENSAFGVTRNPHDISRVPGGSSGGSAAAVSYGGALLALGSDTGGSIRQPASLCGVVGLKPTYGVVSRYGLIALGSSFDQVGPFGKSVGDVETCFNFIKGYDVMDSTSLAQPLDSARDKQTTHRLRSGQAIAKPMLGIPKHFFEKGVDADVLDIFNLTIEKLKSEGYGVKEVELPRVKHSLAVYYILLPAEASANLSRYDGVKYGFYKEGKELIDDYFETRGEGFGIEIRRRILLGTYVLSAGYYDAYFGKANVVRALITEDFKQAFNNVDAILTPTTPTPAFKIGEKSDPLSMYLSDIFTVPANLTGMPGLSVPAGNVLRDGLELPVGLQILGPHFSETTLFNIGKDILNESR